MVNANNKEMEHVLCRPSPPLQCVACMAAGALLGGTAPGNLCPCDPQTHPLSQHGPLHRWCSVRLACCADMPTGMLDAAIGALLDKSLETLSLHSLPPIVNIPALLTRMCSGLCCHEDANFLTESKQATSRICTCIPGSAEA